MNLLPTYEQLIAERLEGITIPDMADAIWVRIETALDVELPVNEPPATPVFNNPAVWLISAGVLAIIISIFLLFRKGNTAPAPPRHLPKHSAPVIQPDTSRLQDYKPPPNMPRPAKKKINANPVNEKPGADTLMHIPFIKAATDSLIKTPPVITMPPADTTKTLIKVKQRKKYGVELSDSDYKFNVKPKD